MVPLHFLAPRMDRPVVPVMFNTLAAPQPNAARCLALGRVIGRVAAQSTKRIGLIATGGLSHDPGEKNHGRIDRISTSASCPPWRRATPTSSAAIRAPNSRRPAPAPSSC
jgi:hypothetical protein